MKLPGDMKVKQDKCSICDGSGRNLLEEDGEQPSFEKCPVCNGTGMVYELSLDRHAILNILKNLKVEGTATSRPPKDG